MLDIPQFVKAEAKRAELFIELAKRIEAAGSLEQAESDAKSRINTAHAEADAILDRAAATAQHDMAIAGKIRGEATAELAKAKADAERIITSAKTRADNELSSAMAKRQAQEDATNTAQKLATDANADLAQIKTLIDQLGPQLAEAQAIIAKAERIKKASE